MKEYEEDWEGILQAAVDDWASPTSTIPDTGDDTTGDDDTAGDDDDTTDTGDDDTGDDDDSIDPTSTSTAHSASNTDDASDKRKRTLRWERMGRMDWW